jgi:Domain of unknown function (DUF4349)
MAAPRSLLPIATAIVAALVGALALAGCSSPESSSPSSAPGGAPAGPPGADAGADSAERAGGGVAEAPAAPPNPADTDATTPAEERSLIYTGTITVKVTQVANAADQAIAIASGLGGVVAGDNRTIDADRSQAIVILRVPSERFTSTLDAMAKLGTEESRQVQAQDVTDSLVDLDARVATQEASVNRVRDLLARAQTIAEIVTLESELTRRQAELDSLKQRRAKLSGLVALATITVVLHGPAASIDGPTEPETGFMAGLKAGWNGFLASVKIVLTVAGWLLPWAIALGVPLWFALWLSRRRRPARKSPPAPPAPLLAPASPPPPATPPGPPASPAAE